MHKIKTFMNPTGGYLHICESCGHKWTTSEHSSALEIAALSCPNCAHHKMDDKSPTTDKLHCPFCGAELMPQNDIENTEPIRARCGKPGCPWFMWAFPWEIWQALISGKKAQDALKVATDFIGFVNTSRHADGALAAMAIGKLNEITSITKQVK